MEVSTPEAAELTKLLENVFRSVNIALVNELAILCDRMGIDIWEVTDAAATKPYGFMAFKPGPGHGRPLPAGRPVLPRLAGARVRHADRVHRAGRRGEPEDAVLLRRASGAGAERPREGCARLARWASSACRTSQAWATCASPPRSEIIRLLREQGAEIVYHDDFVPELPEHGLPLEWPEDVDCAVIVTAHPGLDVERVVREAPIVVDFRGVTRGIEAPNLVRL